MHIFYWTSIKAANNVDTLLIVNDCDALSLEPVAQNEVVQPLTLTCAAGLGILINLIR